MYSYSDRAWALFVFAWLSSGCAGTNDQNDAGVSDGGVVDVCVSEDGDYLLCQGSHDCFPPDERGDKKACGFCSSFDPSRPGLCSPPAGIASGPATDGQIYVEYEPMTGLWGPYPYEVGPLFAANGGAEQVRFADWSEWTGEPLPQPNTCPSFASFRVCGGNCGACKVGEICTGRSPSHPYSICVSTQTCGYVQALADAGNPWFGCDADAGESCLTFQSSDGGQALADKNGNGFCVDSTACEEATTNYPGGVFCHAAP